MRHRSLRTSKQFTALIADIYKVDKTAAVLAYTYASNGVRYIEDCSIYNLFVWRVAPKGFEYWSKLANKLSTSSKQVKSMHEKLAERREKGVPNI